MTFPFGMNLVTRIILTGSANVFFLILSPFLAYFVTMQIRIKPLNVILLAHLLQASVVLADSKIKLLDYVEQDAKSWISVHEKVSKTQVRLFITPERTFPGCASKLKLKKSQNHQNVIQISCDDSEWKTEIRYSVAKDKKSGDFEGSCKSSRNKLKLRSGLRMMTQKKNQVMMRRRVWKNKNSRNMTVTVTKARS